MESTDKLVTIVSGLPRSGTSMMMQMIDRGGIPALTDELRVANEDNPKGYYEFEPVKKTKEDPSWLSRAGGKVVKMVYRLLYDLPADYQYQVVFMRRNLKEVIASQNKMLERDGRAGGGLPDAKFEELFARELAQCDTWIAQQPNFRRLDVNYNDMLADPRGQIARINEFLGGRLDVEAMAHTVDPNLYRNKR